MLWPAVSVVIPALNAAEWIGPTLDSVVQQTYPKHRLDIVVVDDGSIDDTAAQAQGQLAASGLAYRILRNSAPQGPSAARNQGWRHSRGEWIQFLDADDLIDPTKIELQTLAARDAEAAVAVIFSRWSRLTNRTDRWVVETSTKEALIGNDPILDLLRADNFIATGSQLFRRAWLERVDGYNESYRLIEDVDLLVRIAIQGGILRVAPSPTPLFYYRQRLDSLSASNKRAFIDGCVRNARLAERHWREHDQLTPARINLLLEVYFLGTHFYAEHDRHAFFELAREIYGVNPAFVPSGPMALHFLSKMIGYTLAERCLVQLRRLKRFARMAFLRYDPASL